MRLGITELIVVALVAIAYFKPEKLKDYMKAIKKAAKSFGDTKREIEDEAKEIIEPVVDIKKDIDNAVKGEI